MGKQAPHGVGRPVLSLHASGRRASSAQRPDLATVTHTANGSWARACILTTNM